jgi:hypothetical protein
MVGQIIAGSSESVFPDPVGALIKPDLPFNTSFHASD